MSATNLVRAMIALLVLCAFVPSRSAAADNACSAGEAPDLITGAIDQVIRYIPVGGITAYAVGTTACNIGTCQANFSPNVAEHPLIATNLFRLKDGRFEQIGQSWVKHTFGADQLAVCSTMCQPSDVTHLGVNCSDSYFATTTGNQTRLGPKFEVNATTGVYPYPATDMSQTGDFVYKRLQVHTVDVDTAYNSTAVYFVEAQYVARDDAAGGNSQNNVSYRRATVSGVPGVGPFDLGLTGSTIQQKAAIQAWKIDDPSVVEGVFKLPDKGRILLSGKVTDLGDGTYQYEYALQNINVDRAAGSVRIPLPVGAIVHNVGFHDVDYHSGEPIDGTDWTATVGPTSITWATVGYDVNPMANALRWGTLYNFRFDANVAPATTVVTVGMFKPGTPALSTASTLGPDACVVDGVCREGETCAGCAADCAHQGGGSGCCGNGLCEAGESPCRCAADCGPPPANEVSCGDGIDDDCDGLQDCADPDCCASAACAATDADGDHVGEVCDCDDANGQVHSVPGEVRGLLVTRDVSGAAIVTWSPPLDLGGISVVYDMLRSAAPDDFLGGASCLESAGADTTSVDAAPASPGAAFYLVRAVNGCPLGQGPLGAMPNGQPRPGRACP